MEYFFLIILIDCVLIFNTWQSRIHIGRFEGYGIVIQEAKILNKPMVLTNFNTSTLHIENNVNGFIVPMEDVTEIADKIEVLITNQNIRNQFCRELSKGSFGTENEIEKLYNLF